MNRNDIAIIESYVNAVINGTATPEMAAKYEKAIAKEKEAICLKECKADGKQNVQKAVNFIYKNVPEHQEWLKGYAECKAKYYICDGYNLAEIDYKPEMPQVSIQNPDKFFNVEKRYIFPVPAVSDIKEFIAKEKAKGEKNTPFIVEAAGVRAGFNPKYLLNAILATGAKDFYAGLVNANNAVNSICVFESSSCRYGLLPIRLS